MIAASLRQYDGPPPGGPSVFPKVRSMHILTGHAAPRRPDHRNALDRAAFGILRQEARRDTRMVIAVLLVAITTGLIGLVHSLS